MIDLTDVALDAPLDVLVKMVPSFGEETIDADLLSTQADDPVAANGRLLREFNATVSAPVMPGSLHGVLPVDLYVFAHGSDPRKPIRLGRLGWGSTCHVVTEPLKHILERMPGRRSEFYPVSVVYRDPDGAKLVGGGAVVRGLHWIWYCYAVHDLIDVPASRAVFETTSDRRLDVAGHPEVTYDVVQISPIHGLPSLVLRDIPYQEDAAFHVLGWWSRSPFVSPELIQLLHDASSSHPDMIPQLAPTILDAQRAYLSRSAVEAGKLAHKPPLRIAGTNWTMRDEYDLPFFPHRPHWAD